jgi:serine phosphatase RsbU (regulator of sigma subunit)
LVPGDAVILYTDGISDSTDESDAVFSVRRVREIVQQTPGTSISEIGPQLVREVKRFVGSASQLDDICLVGFSRTSA